MRAGHLGGWRGWNSITLLSNVVIDATSATAPDSVYMAKHIQWHGCSEHHVHGSTSISVGWCLPAALLLALSGGTYTLSEAQLVIKSGYGGVRDLGKLCRAAS